MSEIKLTVQDQYLNAFLEFLKTLDYVSIKRVAGQQQNGAVAPLPDKSPIVPVVDANKLIEPLTETTDLATLLEEQQYTGPDRKRFRDLVKTIAIEEPVKELLAQLTK